MHCGIDCTSILFTLRQSAHASALFADELIRQVTIEGAERGLLFLRIRDEARMRIAAYQTLYESSLAFAVRKAVQGEEEKNVLEARIKDMMSDRREKLKYIAELQERADSSDAINEERWTAMKKKQVQEIKSLKELYKNQTKQLQEALAPPPGFVRPA
jgi:dynein light intermediate chain